MLAQGLVLLIAGMGIVYVFLMVLVVVMNQMAKIIPHFNYVIPDDEPKKKARSVAAPSSDDAALAVAVAVAYSKK